MPEKDKKKNSSNRVSDKDRFKYIGFEVFPGTPKDLFKSDTEKDKLVDEVRKKRGSGNVLRDDNSLMKERISSFDRIILTVASVVIILTLFFPWYAVYNEIEETVKEQAPATIDSTALAFTSDSFKADSMAVSETVGDSTAMLAETASEEKTPAVTEETEGTTGEDQQGASATNEGSSSEEILHSYVAKKKIHKEYVRKSGIGSLISIGSIGGSLFSSGFILILTAIVLIIYTLLCIGLPIYTLFGIYGIKGSPDEKATRLKKIFRYNWLPLCLFILALFLSFFGGNYGFDANATFSSLGDSYGIGVFLGSLSWGIVMSLGGFILTAVKGAEI
ncbi:MAG: hypothetical protein U9N55_06315 [candidate division Zixibacteria bacterium]|nr:hypothetical protein [candidate division Zixibacteria bacterium]